jgi:hypothetical protein
MLTTPEQPESPQTKQKPNKQWSLYQEAVRLAHEIVDWLKDHPKSNPAYQRDKVRVMICSSKLYEELEELSDVEAIKEDRGCSSTAKFFVAAIT